MTGGLSGGMKNKHDEYAFIRPGNGATYLRGVPDSVSVVKVFRVLCLGGTGDEDYPSRAVEYFYNMDGKLLAIIDPCFDDGELK